jgi:hypothetical protein
MSVLEELRISLELTPAELRAVAEEYSDAIDDADGDPENFEDLCDEVRKTVNVSRALNTRGRRSVHESDVQEVAYKSSPAEDEASRVYWDRMLRSMAALPDVVQFRHQLPNGKLLPRHDAYLFVWSPLAALFSQEALDALGVTPLEPKVFIKPIGNYTSYRYEVLIPRLGQLTLCVHHDPGDLLRIGTWVARPNTTIVEGADEPQSTWVGHRSVIAREDNSIIRWHRSRRLFNFPAMDGWHAPSAETHFPPFAFRGTVMGEALQIASDIAQTWHLPPDDILHWLLTDDLRVEPPLRTQVTSVPVFGDGGLDFAAWSIVSITALPWVSSNRIERHFREVQDFIYAQPSSTQKAQNAMSDGQSDEGDAEDSDASGNDQSAASAADATKTKNKSRRRRFRLPDDDTLKVYGYVLNERAKQDGLSWGQLAQGFEKQGNDHYSESAFQQKFNRGRTTALTLLLPIHEQASGNMRWREKRYLQPDAAELEKEAFRLRLLREMMSDKEQATRIMPRIPNAV